MYKRNVMVYLISLQVYFPTDDRSHENENPTEQKERHPKLFSGDRVFNVYIPYI